MLLIGAVALSFTACKKEDGVNTQNVASSVSTDSTQVVTLNSDVANNQKGILASANRYSLETIEQCRLFIAATDYTFAKIQVWLPIKDGNGVCRSWANNGIWINVDAYRIKGYRIGNDVRRAVREAAFKLYQAATRSGYKFEGGLDGNEYYGPAFYTINAVKY